MIQRKKNCRYLTFSEKTNRLQYGILIDSEDSTVQIKNGSVFHQPISYESMKNRSVIDINRQNINWWSVCVLNSLSYL